MNAPLPLLRRGLIVLVAMSVFGLAACKPAATARNDGAAPLIVDGNFDEANFVVPADEGSGAENASVPTDNATTAAPSNFAGSSTRTSRH